MFENLADKLQGIFKKLGGKGKLTEQDIDQALREVRVALLEADVHFRVVKELIARVRERALGQEVMASLTPAQQVIKIVREELIATLGPPARLELSGPGPAVVMLVGLQGSGKTTTAAKLGLQLRKQGQRPLLVAADPRRPAAVQQLVALGQQIGVPVHSGPDKSAADIAAGALRRAREIAASAVLLDTGGRLHIDEALMPELAELKARLAPAEVLLVADGMTGQDAVRAAEEFHQRVGLTGLILTKMDGDARGGAALSIRSASGVPIKYLGVGEKLDALEAFHPDRLASRILGMGDMLTLIERAQETWDQQQAQALEKKLRKARLDLEDFLAQLQQLKKMGPLSQWLGMVPGLGGLSRQLSAEDLGDQQLKRLEAIIQSMTPQERRHPEIIDGSRRRRIARGSGTTPQEINQLLHQFRHIQKMLQAYSAGAGRGKPFPKLPFPL